MFVYEEKLLYSILFIKLVK